MVQVAPQVIPDNAGKAGANGDIEWQAKIVSARRSLVKQFRRRVWQKGVRGFFQVPLRKRDLPPASIGVSRRTGSKKAVAAVPVWGMIGSLLSRSSPRDRQSG